MKKALGFVLLFLLAVILRVPGLGKQPLWTDEANCLAIAQGATGPVWNALQHDCSPPLYYWLMGLSVGNDRPTEVRVRLLSMILGIVSVPLLAWVGWRLMGSSGLMAGLFLAISPLHVWHSQEARMYTLVLLLGVLMALLTVEARRKKGRTQLLFLVVIQTLMLWTHHFSVFPLAASWGVLLLGSGRIGVRQARPFLLLLILGWLPAAWLLAVQSFVNNTGSWLPPPPLSAPFRSVGLWLAGVEGSGHSKVVGVPLGPFVSGLGALILAYRGLTTSVGRLNAFLAAGGLILAYVTSLFRPAYTPGRYDVSLLPPFLLLLASGFCVSTWRVRFVAVIAISTGAILGLNHYHTRYEKGALNELVRLVEEQEQPGDKVVIVPEVEAPVFNYYYSGRSELLVPPSFRTVKTVDYVDYSRRWTDRSYAKTLARLCWEKVEPGGRIFLLYSPYKQTEHFKGWLMNEATSFTKVRRRVTGSGSTELSILERSRAMLRKSNDR